MRSALPWVGLAIRLAAAAIWLVAGGSKLANLPQFHAQVVAYKLLPGALEAPFAYALPLVEVCLGFYLLIGLLVRPAAIFGCALMVLFITAMAQAAARGLTLDCGCFGSLVREPVGSGTILRDAALGVPTLVLALWPARFLSVDRAWLGAGESGRFAAMMIHRRFVSIRGRRGRRRRSRHRRSRFTPALRVSRQRQSAKPRA